MRPYSSYGGVRQALTQAATEAPGSVRQLAERAQVGYSVAKYTASRMLDRDELVVIVPGRPAVLAAPTCPAIPPGGETLGDALQRLRQCFWNSTELEN
jgi:hypothetical protein